MKRPTPMPEEPKIFDPNVTRMLRECYDFVTLGFRTLDAKSAFRPYGTGVKRSSAFRISERRFLSAFVSGRFSALFGGLSDQMRTAAMSARTWALSSSMEENFRSGRTNLRNETDSSSRRAASGMASVKWSSSTGAVQALSPNVGATP